MRDLLDRGGSQAYTLGRQEVANGIRLLSDLVRACPALGSDSESSSGGEGGWECADCSRLFASERALGQHCRATGHDPAGSDSDSESGRDDSDEDDSDSDEEGGSDGGEFHCRACRQGFRTKGALVQHSRAKRH